MSPAPAPVQNYANHRQYVPLFHFVLMPLLLLTFVGSLVNLYLAFGDHSRLYSAALLVVLTVCVMTGSVLARMFALKAQDRAIRAEEALRHFVLTGRALDPRLSRGQIIALRFASDEELPELARRAAAYNMSADDIKKAVKDWRADFNRV